MYYILDKDHNPVKIEDFNQWATEMQTIKRVGIDEVKDTTVSTVFLGLDHSFGVTDKPVLFETMTFGSNPDFSEFQWRYDSWDKAVKGHQEIVKQIKAGIPINQRRTFKMKF